MELKITNYRVWRMATMAALLSLLTYQGVTAQSYRGHNGKISFFSQAPLEDITAQSLQFSGALDMATGDVAARVSIRSFKFSKALMQEHFNDNYMESEKFPQATFEGKLLEKLQPRGKLTNQMVEVEGTLTIHGVPKQRRLKLQLKQGSSRSIVASGKFTVTLADHQIKIPQLLFQNIAESVEMTFELTLNEIP
jgi:polyisoprenoid-binding protein YceI